MYFTVILILLKNKHINYKKKGKLGNHSTVQYFVPTSLLSTYVTLMDVLNLNSMMNLAYENPKKILSGVGLSAH